MCYVQTFFERRKTMGWFGKLTFGSLGLFLGGPLGAIAGAALGHHLVDKKGGFGNQLFQKTQEPMLGYAEQTQATYFISLFSILGKLSKADGVVSEAEIAVVQNFINQLPMDEREKQFAKQVFNEAKKSPYAIEDFAMQVYQTVKGQPALLQSYFDLLFQLAAADGTLHPAEEAALKKIQSIFRITDTQYDDIKAVYFKDIDKYYRILNCTSDASNAEIKSNYKNLVKDFHPDTIVSKGLPEEFSEFATKRFREIQEAYEKIREARSF
jgi:DnaJ like chaperone protein